MKHHNNASQQQNTNTTNNNNNTNNRTNLSETLFADEPFEITTINDNGATTTNTNTNNPPAWKPSSSTISSSSSTTSTTFETSSYHYSWCWKDFWYFVGPGWLVSIAYIDPGNYQADIQAGATTRYYLLFAIWWSSILSIYVQILCVRLAYYSQLTLAEVQARDAIARKEQRQRQRQQLQQPPNSLYDYFIPHQDWERYVCWFLAEISAILTDLPEVIGIGIACHTFFGWDYYIGILASLMTTMIFLATLHCGIQVLEWVIFGFVGIMSVALWLEMTVVVPKESIQELVQGWTYGFIHVTSNDIFRIAGIIGSVVMPHNLYLHTAAIQSRRVERQEHVIRMAVKYSSWEPVVPILVSFFVNMAVVAIAAESVFDAYNNNNNSLNGNDGQQQQSEQQPPEVGLTNFCHYFSSLKGGCYLWAIALLAAGQSSAITTTFTGQYVMDGFLQLSLPTNIRAIVTRLLAILPCVLVSVLMPNKLNELINFVNAALSFLLPFAFVPLVKYNCSPIIMGGYQYASQGMEKYILYTFAILVWAINAVALSIPGGGFFGDFVPEMPMSMTKVFWILFQIFFQIGYAWWNFSTLFWTPIGFIPHAIEEEERPIDDEQQQQQQQRQFARSLF